MSVLIVERKPVLRNLDYRFGLLIIGLGAGLVVAAQAGVDPRLLSSVLGSIALGGLLYRLLTTWTETPVLVHVLAIIIVVWLLFGAIAGYQLSDAGAIQTVVSWPSVALRLAVIVVVIHWPRWVERRESPFFRP